MNGAPPDWQDGECCFRCRSRFGLSVRKHHCRNCGNIFCAKCSSQQLPLPHLNIEKSVRVCDSCHEKLTTDDPTTLDLDKNSTPNGKQTKSKSSNSNKTSDAAKSSSNSKQAATAPSEQELKEEEELQLALALSLSETPSKISFPDCRQFEEPSTISTVPTTSNSNHVVLKQQSTSTTTTTSTTRNSFTEPQTTTTKIESTTPFQIVANSEKQQPSSSQVQYTVPEQQLLLDRDQELFRFVAEVRSTAEVFTNRIDSNKSRNKSIKNDSGIQDLFLRLTNMHQQLLEYIKIHDEERSGFEALQDKLSQISDARAALDALREEHQEKIRQEAAEAERLRQSQLASKLEMMRQKKSQMMQYQREIALQRIQAQELMLRQPQGQYQTVPITTDGSEQQDVTQNTAMLVEARRQATLQQLEQQQPHASMQHQEQTPVFQQPINQQTLFQPQVAQQFIPNQINQTVQQQQPPQQAMPPAPKPDDDAPLISFDD